MHRLQAVNRRDWLCAGFAAMSVAGGVGRLEAAPRRGMVETVRGPVRPEELGVTLIHEHILVDFIGADKIGPGRYQVDEVIAAARPKLEELKQRGCRTLVECTPAYIGRDPLLLRRLSEITGLHLVTNTGYYGAANDKFVPQHAYQESAEQLAARWTVERLRGVEKTGVFPAFQKIGVDAGPLSAIDRKLIQAGAICHRKTRLRLHVHTGDGRAALDILDELAKSKTPAGAYVWVHAQNEKDRAIHLEAARRGAWLEFDGIRERSLDAHLKAVVELKEKGFLNQLLISQDSGWYRPGEPGGGQFNGYVFLFDQFLPALRRAGFTEADVDALMKTNPARVLTV